MKEIVNIFIKGILIGSANVIPGISGGTMAFVLGVYERLTESIGCFFLKKEKQKEYVLFLSNIGIGIILGFLLFSRIVIYLLGINQPEALGLPFSYVPTFGFFLGLILGSIPILVNLQNDTKFSWQRAGLVLFGMLVIFGIGMLKPSNIIFQETYPIIRNFGFVKLIMMPIERILWLFFVGILAAFTMVIPGVSGSALLVTLGEYGPILGYISDRSIIPIGAVSAGIGLGIVVSTIFMSKLFEKRPGATFYFVLGLVVTSCIQIVIRMINAEPSFFACVCTAVTIIFGILTALQSAKLGKY